MFAVPGKISDIYSAGCNNLIIRNIASMITKCEDLMKYMRWDMFGSETVVRQKSLFPEITAEEQPVIDFLRSHSDSHINTIGSALGIPMSQLMSMLLDLEFKGAILVAPGNRYSIAY